MLDRGDDACSAEGGGETFSSANVNLTPQRNKYNGGGATARSSQQTRTRDRGRSEDPRMNNSFQCKNDIEEK